MAPAQGWPWDKVKPLAAPPTYLEQIADPWWAASFVGPAQHFHCVTYSPLEDRMQGLINPDCFVRKHWTFMLPPACEGVHLCCSTLWLSALQWFCSKGKHCQTPSWPQTPGWFKWKPLPFLQTTNPLSSGDAGKLGANLGRSHGSSCMFASVYEQVHQHLKRCRPMPHARAEHTCLPMHEAWSCILWGGKGAHWAESNDARECFWQVEQCDQCKCAPTQLRIRILHPVEDAHARANQRTSDCLPVKAQVPDYLRSPSHANEDKVGPGRYFAQR